MKKGTKYALVVGKKVYTLDGHEAELDKLAGERATVKGSVMGEMVMVESVAAAAEDGKVCGGGETDGDDHSIDRFSIVSPHRFFWVRERDAESIATRIASVANR